MLENIKKVDNPLTVIAIFAAIAEIAMSVSSPFLKAEVQAIFVWFQMGFPLLLVVAFFLTLNFNHKVLYAPSDYRDDKSFFQALGTPSQTFAELRVTEPAAFTHATINSDSAQNQPMTQFAGVSLGVNAAINGAFTRFSEKSRVLFTDGLVSAFSLAPQGGNVFLLQVDLKSSDARAGLMQREPRIIEAKQKGDSFELSVVGKSYASLNPIEFGELLFSDVSASIALRQRQ